MTALASLFDDDVEVMEEIAGEMSINTPLISLTFHTTSISTKKVDGSRTNLPINLCNSIADQLCLQMARLTYDIQVCVDGTSAVGKDQAKEPREYFDEQTGDLLDQYAQQLDETRVDRAELLWAEYLAYAVSLSALIKEQKANVRNAPPIVFAYVSARNAETFGFQTGPINSPKEAIRYRCMTHTKRLSAQRNAKDVASTTPDIDWASVVSA
jgi:hypothetical protein